VTDLLTINPLKVAAEIGHGAALNAMLAFGVEADRAEWWSAAGEVRTSDPFAAADRLAATFCRFINGVMDPQITGERVWREAAEAHLHNRSGNDWPRLPVELATAFSVFGLTVGRVFLDLRAARDQAKALVASRERALRRKPVKLEDTIYEPMEDMGAREGYAVRALEMSKRKPAASAVGNSAAAATGPAAPGGLMTRPGPPAKSTKGKQQKITIGERPIDMAKQRPGQHGGKREAKGK
jgi:hypothetical protein